MTVPRVGASHGSPAPVVLNFIAGLGGRDVSIANCQRMLEQSLAASDTEGADGSVTWIGVRE